MISSGDLKSVEYTFIAIIPRPSLTLRVVTSVKIPSVDKIDLFKDYLYVIGILDII